MAEVGEGNLNWPAIIKSCKSAGVEWYLVEQDTCYRDAFESVAISLRNMMAMGLSYTRALSALRLTLGRWSTEDEVRRAAGLLAQTIASQREKEYNRQ